MSAGGGRGPGVDLYDRFTRGMISGGLDGMLRSTFIAEASYTKESWKLAGR